MNIDSNHTSHEGINGTNNTTDTPPDHLLKTFHTKHTPVFSVAFTRRNLLLSAGPFLL